MDIAIVTGASSGIGLEISRRLASTGFKVYGLAREFEGVDFKSGNFIRTPCDITDAKTLRETARKILSREHRLDLLVNDAGTGVFGPHETLSHVNIQKMVETNLTAPMVLTSYVLRALRDSGGAIVNIASIAGISVKSNGAAYNATKAGLIHFGDCLFEEVRKQGVRVTTVCPDITANTGFYEGANFEPYSASDAFILPTCVADAVMNTLDQRDGTVISKIVVQPQRFQIAKKPARDKKRGGGV